MGTPRKEAGPRAPAAANQRGAARLAAVQALYQMELSGATLPEVLAEFETYRLGKEVDGEQYRNADAAFFRDIVSGVVRDQRELDPAIHASLTEGWPLARVDATLRALGATVAPGSTVVFTYVHRGLLDGSIQFDGGAQILTRVRRVGEPWTMGFAPSELPAYLAARGLTLVDDLSAVEYRAKYFGSRASTMTGYSFYRVATARLGR